jgi:hypothetical protein
MKELLTKQFWQDVKKTFEEAQQNAAPHTDELEALPEDRPTDTAAGDIPPGAFNK